MQFNLIFSNNREEKKRSTLVQFHFAIHSIKYHVYLCSVYTVYSRRLSTPPFFVRSLSRCAVISLFPFFFSHSLFWNYFVCHSETEFRRNEKSEQNTPNKSGCRFDCVRFFLWRILTQFFSGSWCEMDCNYSTRQISIQFNWIRMLASHYPYHNICRVYLCNQLSISCTPLSIKALTCSCSNA